MQIRLLLGTTVLLPMTHLLQLLQEVQRVGVKLGVPCRVIRGNDLQEKGFGGIYGVGKAAVVPPALAVLSYTPPGARDTIAWVGKGIVYDTGGLSIKGKVRLHLVACLFIYY